MKLARRALDDPGRKIELEAAMDDRVSELIAEANDAGYSTEEAMDALLTVAPNLRCEGGAPPGGTTIGIPDPAAHACRHAETFTQESVQNRTGGFSMTLDDIIYGGCVLVSAAIVMFGVYGLRALGLPFI